MRCGRAYDASVGGHKVPDEDLSEAGNEHCNEQRVHRPNAICNKADGRAAYCRGQVQQRERKRRKLSTGISSHHARPILLSRSQSRSSPGAYRARTWARRISATDIHWRQSVTRDTIRRSGHHPQYSEQEAHSETPEDRVLEERPVHPHNLRALARRSPLLNQHQCDREHDRVNRAVYRKRLPVAQRGQQFVHDEGGHGAACESHDL